MAYIVRRVNKKTGAVSEYWQASVRVPGRRTPKPIYLGMVNPKRKRRGGGLGGLNPAVFIAGALMVAGHMLRGTLGTPGGQPHATREPQSNRPDSIFRADQREADRIFGVDRSSKEKWDESMAHLTPETYREWMARERVAASTYHAAKAEEKAAKDAVEAPITDPSEAPESEE